MNEFLHVCISEIQYRVYACSLPFAYIDNNIQAACVTFVHAFNFLDDLRREYTFHCHPLRYVHFNIDTI